MYRCGGYDLDLLKQFLDISAAQTGSKDDVLVETVNTAVLFAMSPNSLQLHFLLYAHWLQRANAMVSIWLTQSWHFLTDDFILSIGTIAHHMSVVLKWHRLGRSCRRRDGLCNLLQRGSVVLCLLRLFDDVYPLRFRCCRRYCSKATARSASNLIPSLQKRPKLMIGEGLGKGFTARVSITASRGFCDIDIRNGYLEICSLLGSTFTRKFTHA
jgi:hypothetical protein